MSFSISKRAAGEIMLDELTKAVNDALRSSPDEDHDAIRLAADTASKFIGETTADESVDVNFGGAKSENARALTLSVTVTQLRPKAAEEKAAQFAPWAPPSAERMATDRPG